MRVGKERYALRSPKRFSNFNRDVRTGEPYIFQLGIVQRAQCPTLQCALSALNHCVRYSDRPRVQSLG
jgi:hypothetical protein